MPHRTADPRRRSTRWSAVLAVAAVDVTGLGRRLRPKSCPCEHRRYRTDGTATFRTVATCTAATLPRGGRGMPTLRVPPSANPRDLQGIGARRMDHDPRHLVGLRIATAHFCCSAPRCRAAVRQARGCSVRAGCARGGGTADCRLLGLRANRGRRRRPDRPSGRCPWTCVAVSDHCCACSRTALRGGCGSYRSSRRSRCRLSCSISRRRPNNDTLRPSRRE
jgi:hypothetical protein